jgi:hypothetical protein
MAIVYTWEVTGLKTTTVANTDNVVVQTYWKKIGTDEDGIEGVFNGATPFSVNNMPPGTNFIPFEDLTEEEVISWIKAVVVDDYAEHVNNQIQKQIDDKKNPVVEVSLPWAPNTVVSNTAVSNT